jgi:hypothetical protein
MFVGRKTQLQRCSHWAQVAHTCNPSYSGDRDQEDHDLKPILTDSSQDPIFKKNHKKRAGGVAQDVGPEIKPQYHKKIHLLQLLYIV